MNKLFLIGALSLCLIASCTSANRVSDKKKGDEHLKVEFIGSTPLTITNKEAKVQLYAIAENIADVPASLLEEKTITESEVPFTVDFVLPKDHKLHIKPAAAIHEVIKYYVTVKWDSDGNGKVEKGDITIDYDRQFPYVALGAGKQQVYLTKIK
jgi:hypothetical protein